MRLPKLGPRNTKNFFEEYFYGCLVALFLGVTILLKAGGMTAYNAIVVGLWLTVFIWFARQAQLYFQEGAKAEVSKNGNRQMKKLPQAGKVQMPPGVKPIMGPQWPLRSGQTMTQPSPSSAAPAAGNKQKAFVYERPTLPDRKPKLPANWAGAQDKKPKR